MTYEARDDKLRMVEVAIEARQRLAAIYEEVPFVYQPDMMLVAAEELERSASQIRDYVKTGHPNQTHPCLLYTSPSPQD